MKDEPAPPKSKPSSPVTITDSIARKKVLLMKRFLLLHGSKSSPNHLREVSFAPEQVSGRDVGGEDDFVDDVDDTVLSLHVGLLNDGTLHTDRFAVNGQSDGVLFIQRHEQLAESGSFKSRNTPEGNGAIYLPHYL